MTTETIEWFDPANEMPDDDETVLLSLEINGLVVVDTAWRSGANWRLCHSGGLITLPALAWAPMPTGPHRSKT